MTESSPPERGRGRAPRRGGSVFGPEIEFLVAALSISMAVARGRKAGVRAGRTVANGRTAPGVNG